MRLVSELASRMVVNVVVRTEVSPLTGMKSRGRAYLARHCWIIRDASLLLLLRNFNGSFGRCRGKVEMSAFPQSTWPGQFSETASEQSCHSPHQSAPPHRGLVPSRPPFKAPKGSLDGWPRCNTMRSERSEEHTSELQ